MASISLLLYDFQWNRCDVRLRLAKQHIYLWCLCLENIFIVRCSIFIIEGWATAGRRPTVLICWYLAFLTGIFRERLIRPNVLWNIDSYQKMPILKRTRLEGTKKPRIGEMEREYLQERKWTTHSYTFLYIPNFGIQSRITSKYTFLVWPWRRTKRRTQWLKPG